MEIKITCDGTEYIDYRQLKPFQGNLKTITEENLQKLKNSIIKYGFTVPAFVWQSGDDKYILDAHQRQKALNSLYSEGYDIPAIPVVYIQAQDETEAKEKLLHITSQYGEFTQQGFTDFVCDLDFDFADIRLVDGDFDFSFAGENEETEGDDDIQDDVESITKLGDLWELGKNRLLCGDSTDPGTVGVLMDGKKAELLFTSPPYSDMRDYGGNDLSIETLKKFIPAFYPFVKYQVINLGLQRKDHEIVEYWQDYIKQAKECGYKLLSWNVWSREGMGGSIANMSSMFRMEHEWIFVFGRARKELYNTKKNKTPGLHKGLTNRQKDGTTKKVNKFVVKEYGRLSSVLKLCYGNSKEHPAVFPVGLPEEYIKAMSKKSDVIIDPFLGSGSTLIACEKTNRTCYGMELDPHYCDIIVNRYIDWCNTNNKTPIVKLNGEIFKTLEKQAG